jgi:hypothetical protein
MAIGGVGFDGGACFMLYPGLKNVRMGNLGTEEGRQRERKMSALQSAFKQH